MLKTTVPQSKLTQEDCDVIVRALRQKQTAIRQVGDANGLRENCQQIVKIMENTKEHPMLHAEAYGLMSKLMNVTAQLNSSTDRYPDMRKRVSQDVCMVVDMMVALIARYRSQLPHAPAAGNAPPMPPEASAKPQVSATPPMPVTQNGNAPKPSSAPNGNAPPTSAPPAEVPATPANFDWGEFIKQNSGNSAKNNKALREPLPTQETPDAQDTSLLDRLFKHDFAGGATVYPPPADNKTDARSAAHPEPPNDASRLHAELEKLKADLRQALSERDQAREANERARTALTEERGKREKLEGERDSWKASAEVAQMSLSQARKSADKLAKEAEVANKVAKEALAQAKELRDKLGAAPAGNQQQVIDALHAEIQTKTKEIDVLRGDNAGKKQAYDQLYEKTGESQYLLKVAQGENARLQEENQRLRADLQTGSRSFAAPPTQAQPAAPEQALTPTPAPNTNVAAPGMLPVDKAVAPLPEGLPTAKPDTPEPKTPSPFEEENLDDLLSTFAFSPNVTPNAPEPEPDE